MLTDLLVVVGFEPAVQPFGSRVGPNVGAWNTQVLPQWAAMLITTAILKTVAENATKSLCFIADLRSSLFLRACVLDTEFDFF